MLYLFILDSDAEPKNFRNLRMKKKMKKSPLLWQTKSLGTKKSGSGILNDTNIASTDEYIHELKQGVSNILVSSFMCSQRSCSSYQEYFLCLSLIFDSVFL